MKKTFEEIYAYAIEEIEKLNDGDVIVFHPEYTTVARTLGYGYYNEGAVGIELIEKFIKLKKEKKLTVYFYITNINIDAILGGLRDEMVVDSRWIEKHPELKVIEL